MSEGKFHEYYEDVVKQFSGVNHQPPENSSKINLSVF